jgi:hypothetical protein
MSGVIAATAQDAIRIAAIWNRCCEPLADTKLALRLAQQQQPGIRRLVAPVETYCDFLAMDGWQIEGKRRIFGHGGCGALWLHKAVRRDIDLLCESGTSRYSRREISTAHE